LTFAALQASLPPIGSQGWRPNGFRPCNIEIQFAQETGKTRSRIALNGHFWPCAGRSKTVVEREAVRCDCLAGLVATIPRLSSAGQQADMMVFQSEIAQNGCKPPPGGWPEMVGWLHGISGKS
jgi:hypothetical protein